MLISLLPIAAAASPNEERCAQVQSIVDGQADLDRLAEYLRISVEKQEDLNDLFLCANRQQKLPLGESAGSLLKGNGWGSLRPAVKVPGWNQFQAGLGRTVWGGKVLQRQENGDVYLKYYE